MKTIYTTKQIYKTERGTLEARIMNPTPTASKRTARTTVPVWQQRLNHHTRGDQTSAPGAARPLATPMNSRGRTHVRQSVQSTSTQPPHPPPRWRREPTTNDLRRNHVQQSSHSTSRDAPRHEGLHKSHKRSKKEIQVTRRYRERGAPRLQ